MQQPRFHSFFVAFGLLGIVSLGSFAAAQDVTILDSSPSLYFVENSSTPYQWHISATFDNFYILDDISSTFPFRIIGGAPDYSLVIGPSGIGLGAFDPQTDLHIFSHNLA